MKREAQKAAPRSSKKPIRKRSQGKVNSNGFSPIGSRVVENEWLAKHREKVAAHAGEYVVVEGRRIVAHNKDAAKAVATARRRGVRVPYIFFVAPPLPPNTYRIGLL